MAYIDLAPFGANSFTHLPADELEEAYFFFSRCLVCLRRRAQYLLS